MFETIHLRALVVCSSIFVVGLMQAVCQETNDHLVDLSSEEVYPLSPVSVFSTFEDFQSNNGVNYDSFIKYFPGISGLGGALTFRLGEVKMKIKNKNIWGFSIGEVLFRIDSYKNHPLRVVYTENVVGYENGGAHLEMTQRGTQKAKILYGFACYLSKDLNSEVIPVQGFAKKRLKKFAAIHPESKDLFDCFDGNYNYDSFKNCLFPWKSRKITVPFTNSEK